jgi:hypothetical protein
MADPKPSFKITTTFTKSGMRVRVASLEFQCELSKVQLFELGNGEPDGRLSICVQREFS